MDYNISRSAKDKVCDCKKGFSCLSSGKKTICEISEFVSNDLIFIKGTGHSDCSYCHSFGSSHFCSCPVRKELFMKYRV